MNMCCTHARATPYLFLLLLFTHSLACIKHFSPHWTAPDQSFHRRNMKAEQHADAAPRACMHDEVIVKIEEKRGFIMAGAWATGEIYFPG
jgi:hypothetical protein